MRECFSRLSPNDTILFIGQVKEQLVAPLGVSNVKIIGAATRTRYGNESSFGHPLLDAASAWRPPASPTAATPLLELRQQGWLVSNILWDAPADAAAIQLHRAENATYPDPSSFVADNCQFSDGEGGIYDVGGCYNILIQNSRFRALTTAIKTVSTGIAVPLRNTIQGNTFIGNTNDINGSYSQAVIQNNLFLSDSTVTINTIAVSAQGDHNMVINNYVPNVAADIDPAHGYTGSATDVWRTFATDQADPVITSPPV
jgi:hypothetical protein